MKVSTLVIAISILIMFTGQGYFWVETYEMVRQNGLIHILQYSGVLKIYALVGAFVTIIGLVFLLIGIWLREKEKND